MASDFVWVYEVSHRTWNWLPPFFIERTSMETWIFCFINYYLTQHLKIESKTTSDLLVTLAMSKPMYRMVCSGGRNWLRYWSAFIICSLTIRSLSFFSFVCTTNNQSNASIRVTWPQPYCFIQIFTKWHASNFIFKVLNFCISVWKCTNYYYN